jgi:thiol-disulfide isomerase/thioredoxin
MNRLLRAALAGMIALSLSAGDSEDHAYPKGSRRDMSALGMSDGSHSVTVGDFKGKVVVVDFWATWCPPCRQSIPELLALQKAGAAKGTLVVLPVNMDDDGWPAVQHFISLNRAALADFKVYRPGVGEHGPAKVFQDITAFPSTLVIDKEGKLAFFWTGYGEGMLVQRINQVLREP